MRELRDGESADLVETDGERVRKVLGESETATLSPFRALNWLQSDGSLSGNNRAENYLGLAALDDVDGFRGPEVYSVNGDVIEMEFVDGEDLVMEMDEDPAKAELMGERLKNAHESGVAFRDFNSGNFVWDGKNIIPVDGERFSADASIIDIQYDQAAAFYSFEQVHGFDEETLNVFSQGYGYTHNKEEIYRSISGLWEETKSLC
jgi:tRNA A-37 threonylcarbamoyl transferase component Bud32